MGRTPCCDKVGLKKGPWTPEEDHKLLAFVDEHGHGNWRALPTKAGLQRCGKSCRLRWTNYLRPDIKRGKFSLQEEQTIIQLHALLGNRWSAIATHLPKRTDNEIKNYWNTHLKKRLTKMGIDPITHKPKNDALVSNDGQSKSAANLSHMAQWESARLEAEARLARQSKIHPNLNNNNNNALQVVMDNLTTNTSTRCLDVLRAWDHGATWPNNNNTSSEGNPGTHHSPTSTVTLENGRPMVAQCPIVSATTTTGMIEFMGNINNNNSEAEEEEEEDQEGLIKDEWKGLVDKSCNHSSNHDDDGDDHDVDHNHDHDEYNDGMGISMPSTFGSGIIHEMNTSQQPMGSFIEGFTELLLCNFSDRALPEEEAGNNDGAGGSGGSTTSATAEPDQDNKSYWNSILNLVNSSPSSSPLF